MFSDDHYREMLNLPVDHPLYDHYQYFSRLVLAGRMPKCGKKCTIDANDKCPRALAFDSASPYCKD